MEFWDSVQYLRPGVKSLVPSNMSKQVLAAVIYRNSSYLVCQRPPHKHHGGLWEFPGGKLESGETLEDAARRELKEELDLELVSIGRELMAVDDKSSGFQICFVSCEAQGDPKLKEHKDLRWVQVEVLAELPLAPSDKIFSEYLIKNKNQGH